MKLGLQLGYWGAQPPENHAELVAAAEEAEFDTVFTAEAWGSDAFTPLAWWGRETTRMRLGTSVVQLSARTPTACAMASLTLDHLSGGRHILGLGVSGPQVVEGWYGAKFPKPLARTREYVDVIRAGVGAPGAGDQRRAALPLPLTGEGTTGLGKALKTDHPPAARRHPDHARRRGPKNVALTAEIADGWLPIFYSPRIAPMYNEWLDEGFARPGARRSREDFEICATAQVVVTDDRPAIMELMKPHLALYMGGMGPRTPTSTPRSTAGWDIRRLSTTSPAFRTDRKDEAAKVIPTNSSTTPRSSATSTTSGIVGEAAGVTMMVVGARSVEQINDPAELV